MVVKCLDDAGRVYTITPIDDQGSAKNIHRAELKVVPGQTAETASDILTSPAGQCPPERSEHLVQYYNNDQEDDGQWVMQWGGASQNTPEPQYPAPAVTLSSANPATPWEERPPERSPPATQSCISESDEGQRSMQQDAVPSQSSHPSRHLQPSDGQHGRPQVFIQTPTTSLAQWSNHWGR